MVRQAIHAYQSRQIAALVGTVECYESYFGPDRPSGVLAPRKRGRGTLKQPVFGIFERGGRVFTEIVPDVKAKTLQQLIRGKVSVDSVLVTDGWRAYDGLVDVGYDKHLRIKKHRKDGNPFTDGAVQINGIESFWSYTKRRLARFNGVKANFDLHLKECEWRWGKDPDTIARDSADCWSRALCFSKLRRTRNNFVRLYGALPRPSGTSMARTVTIENGTRCSQPFHSGRFELWMRPYQPWSPCCLRSTNLADTANATRRLG